MAVLVSYSPEKVLFDTLPAIKLTQWYGRPARDTVYTYARLYLHPGALCLCLTVFDGHPPASQQAIAGFDFGPSTVPLWLAFSPQKKVSVCCGDKKPPVPETVFSAGSDEQGPYWQAECTLSADWLWQYPGKMPGRGESFRGGFFLKSTDEVAFGSAFAGAGTQPDSGFFTTLQAVPY